MLWVWMRKRGAQLPRFAFYGRRFFKKFARLYIITVTISMEAHMAKKPTNETTSKKVASTAGKLLADPKTPAKVRSVAASALTQRVKKK